MSLNKYNEVTGCADVISNMLTMDRVSFWAKLSLYKVFHILHLFCKCSNK